jgi:hypothetical protein
LRPANEPRAAPAATRVHLTALQLITHNPSRMQISKGYPTMTTFSIKLSNLTIKAYFERPLLLEEILISAGAGILTITLYPPLLPPAPGRFTPDMADASTAIFRPPPGGVRYHLLVDTGTRTNTLRLGQLITFTGNDMDNKPFPTTAVLETTNTGTPALFASPPHVVPWQPFSLPSPIATPVTTPSE